LLGLGVGSDSFSFNDLANDLFVPPHFRTSRLSTSAVISPVQVAD
jgi:hypothetical protein